MRKKWREKVGTIRIECDGEVRELFEIATFEQLVVDGRLQVIQHKLKDVGSPDGREVFALDENTFWYRDAPHTHWKLVQE